MLLAITAERIGPYKYRKIFGSMFSSSLAPESKLAYHWTHELFTHNHNHKMQDVRKYFWLTLVVLSILSLSLMQITSANLQESLKQKSEVHERKPRSLMMVPGHLFLLGKELMLNITGQKKSQERIKNVSLISLVSEGIVI